MASFPCYPFHAQRAAIAFTWLSKIVSAGYSILFALGSATGVSAAQETIEPKLGLQAYTYRLHSFEETLEKARQFGIRFLQAYRGQRLGDAPEPRFHHDMDTAARRRVRELAAAKGVMIVSYGVVVAKEEAEWRRIFRFAQEMGLWNLAVGAPEAQLPLLDRLAQETGVGVSLHNHPAPRTYFNPKTALAAVAPYGPHLGLCADTGHWVRSGYDAVASLRLAEGRIISLHLKDLAERGVITARDIPWGRGVADVAGQITELRRQRFSGIIFIEYEHLGPELDADVARCAEFFHRVLAIPRAAAQPALP